MKNHLKRLVPVLCTGALIVSGCAKQQAVKADQPVAPSTATQAAPAQPQAALSQQSAAPTTGVGSSAIKTEPLQASAAEITSKDLASTLEKIYFDFDSDVLSEAARKTLTDNADKLKAVPGVKIRVEGNCDERGSDDYNLALSERRAQAAVKYLTALGIPSSRLSAIGFGEEKPADAAHNDDAWARNRRDDFTISN